MSKGILQRGRHIGGSIIVDAHTGIKGHETLVVLLTMPSQSSDTIIVPDIVSIFASFITGTVLSSNHSSIVGGLIKPHYVRSIVVFYLTLLRVPSKHRGSLAQEVL